MGSSETATGNQSLWELCTRFVIVNAYLISSPCLPWIMGLHICCLARCQWTLASKLQALSITHSPEMSTVCVLPSTLPQCLPYEFIFTALQMCGDKARCVPVYPPMAPGPANNLVPHVNVYHSAILNIYCCVNTECYTLMSPVAIDALPGQSLQW